MNEKLLIVEDEETLCESLKRVLTREGHDVQTAGSAESAFELLEKDFFDLIITDIILPGMTGIELLKQIKERLPEQIVVIMTAYASLETAVEALRSGAYDYIVKPVMHEEIKQVVKNALKQGALQAENTLLRKQLEGQYDLSGIIAESPAMQAVMKEVRRIASAEGNVLLIGETGTGKGLIARAIHSCSNRCDRPFVHLNCATLLDASALFGHTRGSAKCTGESGKGIIEVSCEGTLFIDGISNLEPDIRTRLLDVVKKGGILPVSGNNIKKVDLRYILSAGNDIEQAAGKCSIIKDLLNSGLTVKLPPLRERRQDIGPLAEYFVRKYSGEMCKKINGLDAGAMDVLNNYRFPGNVRELRNIIERAVILAEGDSVKAEQLPHLS